MTFPFPVEHGNVVAFRRAVGHLVDDGAGDPEVVAPPTFVTAAHHHDPDSRLRPRPGVAWVTSPQAAGQGAGAANGRFMHAEQHYEYHHDLRPGQLLSVETRDGATWTKEGRRGTMRFNEILTEYRDADGRLMVSGRAVRVQLPEPEDA